MVELRGACMLLMVSGFATIVHPRQDGRELVVMLIYNVQKEFRSKRQHGLEILISTADEKIKAGWEGS